MTYVRSPSRAIAIACALATAFFAGTLVWAATPFVIETVDSTGDVGWNSSLALDAQGNPHIGYFDYGNLDLKYAWRSGGIWTIETVDATGALWQGLSLALDAEGNPCIGYHDDTNNDLRYARKSGGVWTIETVDSLGPTGYSPSIALDSQGNPHISYSEGNTDHDLKYATKSGGVWVIEYVDTPGWVGTYVNSIALDAQGNPRISYHDYTNNDLKYAVRSGGVWATEIVDSGEGLGAGPVNSLALDGEGNPHISYNEEHSGHQLLKYASKSGGGWSIEIVDDVGGVGFPTSLELDSEVNPHIGYNDWQTGEIMYATKSESGWIVDTVASTVGGGYNNAWASLELDSHWNPHISYYDMSTKDLMYASVPARLSVLPCEVATYIPCGGSYSLELDVQDVYDLGAFEVCAGYSSSLAQFVGFRPDTAFLESTGRDFYDLDPVACASTCQVSGKRVGAWSLGEDPGPSGDDALGRLVFRRQGNGASEDSVCLEDWELVDTELPPGLIEVEEARGARISHRSFCYGDFNDDGDVSVSDIMEVSGRWGCCEGEACYADMFDVNLVEPGNYCMSAPDSCIDIVDIQEVAARWGLGCPGVVHAPHFAEVLDQKLRVSPDTLEVLVEGREMATLDVVVDDAYDLGALEMTVRFDPSVIQVENVVIGDFLASTGRSVHALGPQIDNERGEVKFGAWTTGETPGPEGGGVIAHVVLAGASQEGETTVEVTEATLAYTHGWPQMVSEVESGIVRTVLSTSVSEPGAAVPRSYALFQNVPNPFNPRTEIQYSVPVGGPVKVAIYDVAGREVAVVTNGPHEAGNFTAVWDGVDLRGAGVVSGIYFVRMEAGDFTATRKTVLLR